MRAVAFRSLSSRQIQRTRCGKLHGLPLRQHERPGRRSVHLQLWFPGLRRLVCRSVCFFQPAGTSASAPSNFLTRRNDEPWPQRTHPSLPCGNVQPERRSVHRHVAVRRARLNHSKDIGHSSWAACSLDVLDRLLRRDVQSKPGKRLHRLPCQQREPGWRSHVLLQRRLPRQQLWSFAAVHQYVSKPARRSKRGVRSPRLLL